MSCHLRKDKLLPLVPARKRRDAAERHARARSLETWLHGQAEGAPLPGSLPTRVEDWPEDAREQLEERAAIMEHHGCLPRDEAERLAEHRVRLVCARPAQPSTDNHLSTAETAELSQTSRPRRGPNRGAETRTGQPGGGMGPPRAVGGRALPDSTAQDEEQKA